MGIQEIYICDDCGKKEEFRPGTDLHNLTKGGWLVVQGIGGVGGVYCPKCWEKYDAIEREKEGKRLIGDLRHQQVLNDIEFGEDKPIAGSLDRALERGIGFEG